MPLAEYYQAPSSLAALTRSVLGSADTWVRLQAVIHPMSHCVPVTSSVPDFRMHGFRLRSRVVYKLIGGYGTFYPRLLSRTTVLKLLKSRSDVRPIGPPGVLSESFRVSLTPLPGSAAAIWQLRKRGTFLPSFNSLRATMCSINECNQKAILYAYITYMQTCFVLVDIY